MKNSNIGFFSVCGYVRSKHFLGPKNKTKKSIDSYRPGTAKWLLILDTNSCIHVDCRQALRLCLVPHQLSMCLHAHSHSIKKFQYFVFLAFTLYIKRMFQFYFQSYAHRTQFKYKRMNQFSFFSVYLEYPAICIFPFFCQWKRAHWNGATAMEPTAARYSGSISLGNPFNEFRRENEPFFPRARKLWNVYHLFMDTLSSIHLYIQLS